MVKGGNRVCSGLCALPLLLLLAALDAQTVGKRGEPPAGVVEGLLVGFALFGRLC